MNSVLQPWQLLVAILAGWVKAHGIEPAPTRRRQTTWRTFIRAHWAVLAAIDFTTVESGLGAGW